MGLRSQNLPPAQAGEGAWERQQWQRPVLEKEGV